MPLITVEVDACDLLEKVSDDDLLEEVKERCLTIDCECDPEDYEPDINKYEVLQLLKKCANMFRDADNPSDGLRIDDLISDLNLI